MAAGVPTYVFSHDPAAAKPVATTSHAVGAVQWLLLADGNSWGHHATVYSYAVNNPLAVALTGPAGTHLTVLSVHVGNTIAATATGSVVATQGGIWSTVASVIGQPTVTASIIGTIAASVSGTVVASVIGQPTVTASLVGVPTVVASVIGQPTVIGSVGATQLGTWSVHVGNAVNVVGSVFTTQAGATMPMRAIATLCGSVLAHPYDGALAMVRSATAVGSSTFYLATDVWTGDLSGFAVLFASSGNAQGVVRTIMSVSNSLVATVDSPWETSRVPHSGQVYKLLIDCRNATLLTLATELSSSTGTLWGMVAQYTVPQSGAATVKPWLDRVRLIDNLATSLEVYQASYWQGTAVTLTMRGTVGAKYVVTSLVGGGGFSQWAGAS